MKVKILLILILVSFFLLTGYIKESKYKIFIVYEGSNEFWDVRFIYRANPEEWYDEEGRYHYCVNDKDELWLRYKGEEEEVEIEYLIFPVGGGSGYSLKRNKWTVIRKTTDRYFSEYDKPVIEIKWDGREYEIKLEVKESRHEK